MTTTLDNVETTKAPEIHASKIRAEQPDKKTWWKVELHCHTLYSFDSRTKLKALIDTCRAKNVNKIAITDHNTAAGALELARMAPDLIIPGEEVFTSKGELLAYYVKETIPARLSPAETIRILRDQGAIISVAHPYDRYRKGAWDERDLLDIIDQIDALEIFNARCAHMEDNVKAKAMATAHNLPGTIGSDAHIPYEIAKSSQLMQPFDNATEFLASLRKADPVGKISPMWVHAASKLNAWRRKYLREQMP